ncbi:hypothetical protein B296_00001130 [Ensete ventricosum]|uniref:Uncharacterized protein n=1 Tax=Ensete ventricosum TaxID=4639 RepID=A0A427BAV6_ENSVE|nr:hypothetical protein B296_00001130 [Ensete ventricosum]
MGAVYYRGRIPSATSESHGWDLIIQMYDQSDWRVGLLQCLYLLKGVRQARGQGRRESIGRKRGREGGECRDKLQVPRQGGRAKAKELYKTGVDRLLIKIAESEELRIDVGVLDQGMK